MTSRDEAVQESHIQILRSNNHHGNLKIYGDFPM